MSESVAAKQEYLACSRFPVAEDRAYRPACTDTLQEHIAHGIRQTLFIGHSPGIQFPLYIGLILCELADPVRKQIDPRVSYIEGIIVPSPEQEGRCRRPKFNMQFSAVRLDAPARSFDQTGPLVPQPVLCERSCPRLINERGQVIPEPALKGPDHGRTCCLAL